MILLSLIVRIELFGKGSTTNFKLKNNILFVGLLETLKAGI